EEIATIREAAIADIKDAIGTPGRHTPMDAPLLCSEVSTFTDGLGDADQRHPYETLIPESLRREVERALSSLTTREADVIRLYFGLAVGEQPMTLEEIGERFDLTRERVR